MLLGAASLGTFTPEVKFTLFRLSESREARLRAKERMLPSSSSSLFAS